MRAVDGSARGRWHSCLGVDLCLTAALLIGAELEVVLGGLGADCAALAAIATLPLTARRRMPVVSFACVAVLAPTLDRALDAAWGQDANALVFLILLASYSVGAHAPPRRSLAAMLAAVAWLAALDTLWGDGEELRLRTVAGRRAVAVGSRRARLPRPSGTVGRDRSAAAGGARGQRARCGGA